ncbi:factor-independent urate hydroxylase [Paenibacillus sp. JDR-2]|uniref:factor-independent urate hydroxylase n=1 Tax=Paenibacillus sp. (strain JDR-2) TaxID=324057 RepID=UPI0001AAF76F|nr:urate oxidase [Paenibacillus sp. JDR-2]ACT01951.1 urate oxidase [Paenibacillus sp. JDR-2]
MLKLRSGRTLYYGKGDVLTYRTYAKPLSVAAVPESAYTGDSNVIFAHNMTFAVSGEQLLTSFTEGDNSLVVATDSMKNFILRNTAAYEGSTTEGLLAFISRKFMDRYPHIDAVELSADRIPFHTLGVTSQAGEGLEPSPLVYRRSHNDHASASMKLVRNEGAPIIESHECAITDLQLIKVCGSSFYGFVRDEYTTLPESYDRPLFIFLDIFWKYDQADDALDAGLGRYVPAEQIRDITHNVFHEMKSPSIQFLIYQVGRRMLTRFPQLAEVRFESNNRTWETIVDNTENDPAGVYTEPRPPFGFQGFTMTQEDLTTDGE